MSASALKLTSRSGVALLVLITLAVAACADAAYKQTDLVSAAQVGEMVARVKAASAGEAASLGAASLGQRLLVERRYSEAYELFSALREKWPSEPALLYGTALAAFNLGRPAEAEPLARSAAEIYLTGIADKTVANPAALEQQQGGADALVLMAVILGARGADNEALKSAQRAVEIAPKYFDAQFTLGRALYSVGDSTGAVKAFRSAMAIKPGDTRALFFLATALEGAGESGAALDAYRELVVRQPEAADGHLGLGVLLLKRGGAEVEKGILELKRAVTIDPNLYEAQVTLGRALLARKLSQESIEHLQRAAALAPGNPEPHYQLALAYRRLGFIDKAVEETAIVKRIHELRRGAGAQNGNARPEQR